MKLIKITITRDDRGNAVVRIINEDGHVHDEASFASPRDAFLWASEYFPDVECVP